MHVILETDIALTKAVSTEAQLLLFISSFTANTPESVCFQKCQLTHTIHVVLDMLCDFSVLSFTVHGFLHELNKVGGKNPTTTWHYYLLIKYLN